MWTLGNRPRFIWENSQMGYILDGSSADCADLSALLSFLFEIKMVGIPLSQSLLHLPYMTLSHLESLFWYYKLGTILR